MLDAATADVVRMVVDRVAGSQARRWGLDRDDVAQQAWVAALEALRTFDPARGALDRFLSWVVRRRLVDYCVQQRCPVKLSNNGALRRGGEHVGVEFDGAAGKLYAGGDPCLRTQAHVAFTGALDRMEPRARAVILREMGEPVRVVGSKGSLRTARWRGREVLREAIEVAL